MQFEEALKFALAGREDCCVMVDKNGDFHVIRSFGVKHWKKHYEVVTTIRMVPEITGRQA